MLPKIQQDQLRSGSLDQLLLPSTEGKKEAASEMSNLKPMFPAVQADSRSATNPAFIAFDGKRDSVLLSHNASPDLMSRPLGWGNYRQPSILHGKPFITTSAVPDGLSQLDLATTSGVTPQIEHSEGLLSPILGKKLIYNADSEVTPFATRNLQAAIAQDLKGNIHYEGPNLFSSISNAHIQEYDGGAEPAPSFDKSKSYLHATDGMTSLNERSQNGASFFPDNGPGTAAPLFRWSENGAMEQKESPWNGKTFDLTTREAKNRSRRHIIHSSPNGKRKAHAQLDVCLQDATAGDVLFANSLKMPGSEQQNG